MRTLASVLALAAGVVGLGPEAQAQYNATAGRSAPRTVVSSPMVAEDGTVRWSRREVQPATDRYGNAAGSRYDLAVDGAFDGETIVVLHLYTSEGFDFALPRAALREKGFSVYRWSNAVPRPAEFRAALARANQLWVISGSTRQLEDEHLQAIRSFFEAGHGVYIWGDNEPYHADANAVATALFGARMEGNLQGNQVVGLQRRPGGVGLLQDHLITTGLEQLFEGITIATVQPSPGLHPLLYGSAGNLVSAYYDQGGRRAIVDGGFTRLYCHWDTAGTARYVKNAAAWLANAERFGGARGRPVPGATPTPARTPTPTVTITTTTPTVTPAAAPVRTGGPQAWWRVLGAALLAASVVLGLALVRGRPGPDDPRGS